MNMLFVAAAIIVAGAIGFGVGKRHARRFQRARRIRIDRFKLKRRHADIELEVFGSREVVDAIRDYARHNHVTTDEAMHQARAYLAEIVPKFNLLAYYRFGAPIARAIMHFLYRPVVERAPLHRFNEHAPKGSVVVYVINHRSNADYVLVAHMLFKFISLSYAVGEWARVWPLNHLFKWFGAYFIRRRYREPLYHAVLSNFVRTITRNGVTQGIFIEGGLSRDGAFGKPKLGMLDYIVSSKRDPSFTAPLFVIPTAINYDRVLEDRRLTEELLGREDRSGKMEKLATTFEFLFKNSLRSVVRRFKRFGYAVVAFGEPISVDEFARQHPALLAKEFEERKPEMQRLAETIMDGISHALPVTPVALLATVFAEHEWLDDREIIAAVDERRTAWAERNWLLREKDGASLWNAAREVLVIRHLLENAGGRWRWNPGERLLLAYYANSLLPFETVKTRGWRDNSVPVAVAPGFKAAVV